MLSLVSCGALSECQDSKSMVKEVAGRYVCYHLMIIGK
jgi:hypothetical protein